MKTIEVTMPDGKLVEIDVNDTLTDGQIDAEVEAVTADYMAQSQPQEATNGMQEADKAQAQAQTPQAGPLEALFPRTMASTPFAGPVEFAKAGVGTALDIASLPGRALASLPEVAGLYQGDQMGTDEQYNALGQSLAQTRSAQGGLAGMAASAIRDPLSALAFTPQGTLIGGASRLAGAVPRIATSRLGDMVRAAASSSRGMLEAIGKGAAETALQTGVSSYDRPVTGAESIAPMAMNTLVSRYGVTPGRLQDIAKTRFYQTAKPPRDIVQKSAGRVSPQSVGPLLEAGVARGIVPDAASPVGEKVLDRLLEMSKDVIQRQEPVRESAFFKAPETGLKIDNVFEPTGARDPITQRLIETNVTGPRRDLVSGEVPTLFPSQSKKAATALEKPYGVLSDVGVLERIAQETNGDLMVSPNRLLDFRRGLDRAAEDVGAFKKTAPELATEAGLYRQARTEANALLEEVFQDAINSGKAKPEDLEAIALFRGTQEELRNLYPWIEAFTKRAGTLTSNKPGLLKTIQGNKMATAKSILSGSPIDANMSSLSLPEAQQLYDVAATLGPKNTPLKSTPVSLADLASRQIMSEEPQQGTVLSQGGASNVRVQPVSKRWSSLSALLESK